MNKAPINYVKPLTHWIIYKSYTVRFRQRSPQLVTGLLTTPEGPMEFRYEPHNFVIHLPEKRITINEHGWELEVVPTPSDDENTIIAPDNPQG